MKQEAKFKIKVEISVSREEPETIYSTKREDVVGVERTFKGIKSSNLAKAKMKGMIAECRVEAVEAMNDYILDQQEKEENKEN